MEAVPILFLLVLAVFLCLAFIVISKSRPRADATHLPETLRSSQFSPAKDVSNANYLQSDAQQYDCEQSPHTSSESAHTRGLRGLQGRYPYTPAGQARLIRDLSEMGLIDNMWYSRHHHRQPNNFSIEIALGYLDGVASRSNRFRLEKGVESHRALHNALLEIAREHL